MYISVAVILVLSKLLMCHIDHYTADPLTTLPPIILQLSSNYPPTQTTVLVGMLVLCDAML